MKAIKPNGDILEGSISELREYYKEDEVMESINLDEIPELKVETATMMAKKKKRKNYSIWSKKATSILKKNRNNPLKVISRELRKEGYDKTNAQISYKKGYMKAYHRW